MAIQPPPLSVEAFDELIQQDAYIGRDFEYIAGEMIEVVSNHHASELAFNLGSLIKAYLREHKIPGRVSGADGGFQIAGERYIPDVAYISKKRQPEPSRVGYNPNIPELVVEVISNPNNQQEDRWLRVKIVNYLSENILVWVVNPEAQAVEVYRANQPVAIVGLQGALSGDEVLPGLSIAVADIFEDTV